MTDDWPNSALKPERDREDVSIPLDRYGIPILNQIVDPESLQQEADVNHLQQDLLFVEDETKTEAEPEPPDWDQQRSELFTEIHQQMLAMIEQTSESIADQLRDEIATTLKASFTEALNEKLKEIMQVPDDADTSDATD